MMGFEEMQEKTDVSIEGLQNVVGRLKELEQQSTDAQTAIGISLDEASTLIKEAHEILDRLDEAFKLAPKKKERVVAVRDDAFTEYIKTQKEVRIKDVPKNVVQSYCAMIKRLEDAGFEKVERGLWRR